MKSDRNISPVTAGPVRGRLAPSPTGDMHIGNARTALVAWLAARAAAGRVVLRIEDIDRPRVVVGAEARILDTFRRLGLDWDEGPGTEGTQGPYRQSERFHIYDQAVKRLIRGGHLFPCACSRAEVAEAPGAPHEDVEGPRYPGTCRDRPAAEILARARSRGREASLRFHGRDRSIEFHDAVAGPSRFPVDDFVVRRGDGVPSYQLAVVVDDIAMGVTQVVRGDDLLPSTARQIALYQALDAPAPAFAHVPLVHGDDGVRLAKRNRPVSVPALLDRGIPPERIIGALAASLGLCEPGRETLPARLTDGFSLTRLPRQPWRPAPDTWLSS